MDSTVLTDRQHWADLAEELAGLGYWRREVGTGAMHWSPNMFRLYGFEPGMEPSLEAIVGRVHPDDVDEAVSWIRALAEGTPGVYRARLLLPDGRICWTEGRGACEFAADGSVSAFHGVVMDVTEQRTAQAALATERARLDLLADNGGDLILELGLDRTIRFVSSAIRRLGYEPEQLIGRSALDFIHPEDFPKVARLATDFRAGLKPQDGDDRSYRLLAADGTGVWMEGKPTPIRDAAGQLSGVISVLRDITERRAAEIALAERETQLRVVAEHTPDVIIQVGLDLRIIYASPAVRRYGYEPKALIGTLATDMIHPEDRARVAGLGQVLVTGAPLDPATDRTYRVRNADGSYHWVEGQADIVRDPQGQPVSMVNLLRDIDSQKAAADALAESERRYRLLADHTQDMIAVCGADGILTFVSPSSLSVIGLAPDEMLGRHAHDFVHPDDRDRLLGLLGAYIAQGPGAPSPRYEYRALHKDGRTIWLESSPRAVFDARGRVVELQDNTRDITERKAAADALVDSERRYRLLTDNATDIIATYDHRGVFSFLSPSVAAVLGYAPDELLGLTSAAYVHPDDMDGVWQAFIDFFGMGDPGNLATRVEYRAIRKDGRTIWLEAHPKAVYDSAGAFVEFQDVIRDVSERKVIEASLADSEQRYRLLAENVTDIVSCTGMDGRFKYFSPSVLGVTGYSAAELMGLSLLETMHPEDAARATAYFESAVRGDRPEGQSLTYRTRHRSGEWLWLECNPTVVRNEAGEPVEFIDVTRDVTARERLEAELRAARDAAEAAAAVKSDFMANMSHEIRTPLTAVIGFSSLISARNDLDPTAREHADRISSAGRALLALVNDVLDFSKLEAGRMELAPKPVNPAVVAREALDLFSLQAESKGLDLVFDPGADLPDCLSLDPKAVGQVLLNLLGNAVKFSETGQVALSLAYQPEAQVLRIAVRDSGPGLSADQAQRLFQRFSQVDASSTRRHGGTGLGLAICKGLVEAMGGEIGVDSVVGQGSTFHFAIPAPLATAAGAVSEEGSDLSGLDGLRLLVVDDNPINRELVRAVLTPLGIEVAEAVDGPTGLDTATGLPFDIILLDIRMPGLDGPQVLARLRAEPGPNQHTPILAFSAEFDGGVAAGFDAFVGKPLDPVALITAIAQWTAFETEEGDSDVFAG